MKYPAKKDAWAVWLFALGVLVLIGIGIFIAMTDLVVGVVVTAPMVLFFCSIYLWASYEITSSHVVVRAGPLPICRVRIDEIMEATPTSSISATAHFALSSDAIRITRRKKIWDFLPRTVSISPQDRIGFLKAIAEASPHLEQRVDGSVQRRDQTAD